MFDNRILDLSQSPLRRSTMSAGDPLRTLAQVGGILVSGNGDLLGKPCNIQELVTGTTEQWFN